MKIRFERVFSLVVVFVLLIAFPLRPQKAKAVALDVGLAVYVALFVEACGISWTVSNMAVGDFDYNVMEMLSEYAVEQGTTVDDMFDGAHCTLTPAGLLYYDKSFAEILSDFVGWLISDKSIENGMDIIISQTVGDTYVSDVYGNSYRLSYYDGATLQLGTPIFDMYELYEAGIYTKTNPYAVTFGGYTMYVGFNLDNGSMYLSKVSPITTNAGAGNALSTWKRYCYVSTVEVSGQLFLSYLSAQYLPDGTLHDVINTYDGLTGWGLVSQIGLEELGGSTMGLHAGIIDLPHTAAIPDGYGLAIDTGLATGSDTMDSVLDKIYDAISEGTLSVNTTVIDGLDVTIGSSIVSAITSVFVPSEEVIQLKIDALTDVFTDRFGILTYPASVLYDFTGRILELDAEYPVFRWNNVSLEGVVVIPAGEYNLNDAVSAAPFSVIYGIYRTIVSAVLVFQFLGLCHRKYEEIVHGKVVSE